MKFAAKKIDYTVKLVEIQSLVKYDAVAKTMPDDFSN